MLRSRSCGGSHGAVCASGAAAASGCLGRGHRRRVTQGVKDELVWPGFRAPSRLEAADSAQELSPRFCTPGGRGGGHWCLNVRPAAWGPQARAAGGEAGLLGGNAASGDTGRTWGSHFPGPRRPKGPGERQGQLEPDMPGWAGPGLCPCVRRAGPGSQLDRPRVPAPSPGIPRPQVVERTFRKAVGVRPVPAEGLARGPSPVPRARVTGRAVKPR